MRVVVAEEDGAKKLSFIYPAGPALPRPDREVVESAKKRVRPEPEVRRAKARRGGEPGAGKGDAGPNGPSGGAVPKVPLKG